MLLLINANSMVPLVAPIGVDYVAGAAEAAGIDVDVLDLALQQDAGAALNAYFATRSPRLVGVTFRNVDDSFWPSARSFLGLLEGVVQQTRSCSDAPIVLGGVGLSIFPERIAARVGADYAVRGDGEPAIVELWEALHGARDLSEVAGLVWQNEHGWHANGPSWPASLALPTARDAIQNAEYFRRGGQGNVETKRGCARRCVYCADPLAKGNRARMRPPADVASEIEALLEQGIDVLHLCDGEFNVPRAHALAVCEEIVRRRIAGRLAWYAYLTIRPFDEELASTMRRAGCVGINFTGDTASELMLRSYRLAHHREHIEQAVRLCREHGITCMVDLLLGGPGETPESVADTLEFFKLLAPDAVGAALGMRLYPGTPVVLQLCKLGPLEGVPGILRKYSGRIDLLQPTFYVSPALGEEPAKLVRELVSNDERFFVPEDDRPSATAGTDHNYNDHQGLVDAIAAGARGAYWDILRRLRH
ncbi:MAG: radical SAM protein [Polyangiaceae bacterium]|nr:radical SAM protein [Polyangiaceae bacterium]